MAECQSYSSVGIVREIDAERRRVTARAVGTLDRDQVLKSIDELYQHESFGPGFDQLIDLGDCDLDLEGLTGSHMSNAILARAETQSDLLRGGRVACVARRDHVFGMLRMLGLESADMPLEFRVFRDLGDAEAWLDTPRAPGQG